MSAEQRTVLDFIRAGYNVAVDACAGSGKSTTILSIAQELTGRKIRQFTYNAMLRHEVKEKIQELGLDNLQVHTYHSFAVKYYSAGAHTDTGIRQVIRDNIAPKIPIPFADIIVLDEAQDMTYLYFQLVVKMAKDMVNKDMVSSTNNAVSLTKDIISNNINHKSITNNLSKSFQLLVLGDYMQGLYEFKGADIRYLTKTDQIWSVLPYLQSPNFKKCTLQTSYRITHQMAKFVNRDMLGEERLKACRDGVPVIYIRRPRQQIEKIVVSIIRRLLDEGESPSDIFILGGSVRGQKSNIRRMENVLTEHDIPCYVPMNEVDSPDDRVIDGKVVFSTFHTVKGRQRKYVFVVGFDQGYFYNSPNIDPTRCPNTLYVACTRATHCLYLLEDDRSRPLNFLKQTQPIMKQCDYIDFKGMPQTYFRIVQDPDKSIATIPTHHVTPTNLIKFVQEDILEEITPILERIFVTECEPSIENTINIPTIIKTKTNGLYEEVSDLNGIAIPAMYFDSIYSSSNASTTVIPFSAATRSGLNNGTYTFTFSAPPAAVVPQQVVAAGGGKAVKVPIYRNLNIDNLGQSNNRPGSAKLFEMINESVQEMKPNDHLFLKRAISTLPEKCETPEQYMYLANVYAAIQEKLYSKLKQIRQDEYDWITPEIVEKCCHQMEQNLGHEFQNLDQYIPEIEKTLIHSSMDQEHVTLDALLYPYFSYDKRFRFNARIDLDTPSTLWELKCTSKITLEHLMQVVLYAWISRGLDANNNDDLNHKKQYKLLNVRTGERLRLEATTDELTQIVVALLRSKYEEPEILDDDEFIAKCRSHILETSDCGPDAMLN